MGRLRLRQELGLAHEDGEYKRQSQRGGGGADKEPGRFRQDSSPFIEGL